MNLYFVIYILGEVAMAAGPLPYDKAECELRREEQLAFFNSEEGRAGIKQYSEEHPDQAFTVDDIKIECVEAETRPEMKNPVKLN